MAGQLAGPSRDGLINTVNGKHTFLVRRGKFCDGFHQSEDFNVVRQNIMSHYILIKYIDKIYILSILNFQADVLFDQFGGGPRLTGGDILCKLCVTNTCLITRTRAKTLEESKEITNLLKKRMGV